MSSLLAFTCDHVMDEFGSTCPDRIFALLTYGLDAARQYATDRGWTLAGADGRDLCPQHGGRLYRLHLAPPNNVQPIRRPDQVATPQLTPTPLLNATKTPPPDNVTPIRPREQ